MSLLSGLLLAGTFVFFVVHLAQGLGRRILPAGSGLSVRSIAVFLTAFALLVFVSELCLLLGVYRRLMLWALFLAGSAVMHLRGYPYPQFFRDIRKDCRGVMRWWRPVFGGRSKVVNLIVLGVILYKLVRVLGLPPLAWDTVTYHATKAAHWVQYGSYSPMVAPLGWESAVMHPPAGELGASLMMLFLGRDFMFGLFDVLAWLTLGVVGYRLARHWGIRPSVALPLACFAVTIPAVWFAVGSLYVDNVLATCVIGALLMTALFVRSRDARYLLFAWMGMGLALTIKATSAPIIALLFLYQCFAVWRTGDKTVWKVLVSGWVIGACLFVPWMIRSVQVTGYPLSPIPLEIAGITLGVAHSGLDWYVERPITQLAYSLDAELQSLKAVFSSPKTFMPHLSVFSLFFVVLTPVAFVGALRKKADWVALPALMIGVTLALYFSPSFSVLRMGWAQSSGRFVLVGALLMILVAPTLFTSGSLRNVLRLLIPIMVLGNVYFGTVAELALPAADETRSFVETWERRTHVSGLDSWAFPPLALRELAVFPVVWLGLITGLWLVVLSSRRYSFRIALPVAVLVVAGFVYGLHHVSSRYRGDFQAQSYVLHGSMKYWLSAAKVVDVPGESVRIAVTSGPSQNQDNWSMYHFLGRELQNEVVYVPVTVSGELAHFGPGYNRREQADLKAWLTRLHEQEVDFVMSFAPAGLELEWMKRESAFFTKVVGNDRDWGMYRFAFPDALKGKASGE